MYSLKFLKYDPLRTLPIFPRSHQTTQPKNDMVLCDCRWCSDCWDDYYVNSYGMEIEHLIEQAKADCEQRYPIEKMTNTRSAKINILNMLAVWMLRAYQLGQENKQK